MFSKEVVGENDIEECCSVYIDLRLKVTVRGKYRDYPVSFFMQRHKKMLTNLGYDGQSPDRDWKRTHSEYTSMA